MKNNRNIGCKKHDNLYGIHGGGNKYDRKKADLILFQHMKENKDGLAPFVYIGIRLFGWLFFNYTKTSMIRPWNGQLIYKVFKKKSVKKPVCPFVHEQRPSTFKAFVLLIMHSPLHILYKECFKRNIIFSAFKRGVVIVNDAENVGTILNDKDNNFPKSGFVNKALKPLLGDSIFNSNGKIWSKSRAILQPALGELKIIRTFSVMQDAAIDMIARLHERSLPEYVDMEPEMSYVTADIILRTILSKKISHEGVIKTIQAFHAYQTRQSRNILLGAFGLPYSRKKLWQMGDVIRNVLKEIIEPRFLHFKQYGYDTEQDILTELLKAKDSQLQESLSLDELVSHITMLFLAGHETSASTLSWALYLISFDEKTQQDLYEEITAVWGDKSNINFDELDKLKKVKNVILETLRLYPPVYVLPRQVYREYIIDDMSIQPQQHVISISPWLIHRSSDNWNDPNEFNPHRFEKISARQKHKECQFIPFSKGKRVCIGEGFAMQETVLTLAYLIRNFHFSIKPGWQPKPVARVTLRSKNGIKLIMKKR